jgi:hypothetical protein
MILTIDRVKFDGKWVELWYKEKELFEEQERYHTFHSCDKAGNLWAAIDATNAYDKILTEGLAGMKIEVSDDQYKHILRLGTVLCDKPPVNWSCSREFGHEGPCAATYIGK